MISPWSFRNLNRTSLPSPACEKLRSTQANRRPFNRVATMQRSTLRAELLRLPRPSPSDAQAKHPRETQEQQRPETRPPRVVAVPEKATVSAGTPHAHFPTATRDPRGLRAAPLEKVASVSRRALAHLVDLLLTNSGAFLLPRRAAFGCALWRAAAARAIATLSCSCRQALHSRRSRAASERLPDSRPAIMTGR